MMTPHTSLLLGVMLLVGGGALGKVFDKCELARVLETQHGMPREDVKSWVCIAEHESTFNTEAINKFNWDGSYDYGLFQLNNKYWCDSHSGKNVCKMSCTALLDADLTDDLRCIRRIIKDTERWKGKGTGLTAWVAYVNRCQNRNLDEYISECYDGTHPESPGVPPIDNFIPRVPEEPISVPEVPISSPIENTEDTFPDPSKNEVEPFIPPPKIEEQPPPADDNFVIIVPSARVPYPSHHQLRAPPDVSRSTAIHVSSSHSAVLPGGTRASGNLPQFAPVALHYQMVPIAVSLLGRPATTMQLVKGGITNSLHSVPVVMKMAPNMAVNMAPITTGKMADNVGEDSSVALRRTHVQGSPSSPLGPSLTVYEKVAQSRQ